MSDPHLPVNTQPAYLRDLSAEAETQLKQSGEWVIAGIESTMFWPKKSQIVEFDGFDFILRAATGDLPPAILLNAQRCKISRKEAQDRILKFASALAWYSGQKVEIFGWAGGGMAIGLGKWRGNYISEFLPSDALPQPADPAAWIALALFREGLSIGSPFYSFLSFFKVIATIHRDGKMRQKWIEGVLEKLTSQDVIDRIKELGLSSSDVSKYLFDEGRNAIAHAEKEIFVNPDSTIDHERIYKDIPLIRALAEFAIQEKFNIPVRESGKEAARLDGFMDILGDDICLALTTNSPLSPDTAVNVPDGISLVARRGTAIHHYGGMRITQIAVIPPELRVVLTDADETVQFSIGLNIHDQKIEFDLLEDMGVAPDYTTKAGIDNFVKFLKFRWCLVCNGRLEVWNEENGKLLGRSDPCVLTNVMINHDHFDEKIAALEKQKASLPS